LNRINRLELIVDINIIDLELAPIRTIDPSHPSGCAGSASAFVGDAGIDWETRRKKLPAEGVSKKVEEFVADAA